VRAHRLATVPVPPLAATLAPDSEEVGSRDEARLDDSRLRCFERGAPGELRGASPVNEPRCRFSSLRRWLHAVSFLRAARVALLDGLTSEEREIILYISSSVS
jgi:hypothetical protein